MARSSSGPSDGAGTTTGTSTGTTGWQRLSQTFLRPPKLDPASASPPPEEPDYARLTDDEKRSRIVTVDPLERKIGYAAAVFAAVVALVTTLPYMVSKIAVTTLTKPVGRHCPSGLTYVSHGSAAATCRGVYPPSHYAIDLGVLLLMAIAIFVTTRIGRRSALAFTTALTGVAFGTFYLLAPFVLVAGWVLLRSWRTQKYGAPNAKTARPGYTPPPRGGTRRARPTPRKRRESTDNGTGPAPRKPPSANKRYTPKAATKPEKKSGAAPAKKTASGAASKKAGPGR